MFEKPRAAVKTAAIVRVGRSKDVEPLIELLRQLFALEPDFAFDPSRQRRGLRLMLSPDPGRRLWVAQVGRRVVGMCSAQIVISTAEGGPAAIVEDVIVDRTFRRRGIGQELLAAVERWARKRGIGRLQLLADRWNSSALNFYSRQDWVPTRLVCLRHWVRGN